MFLNRFYYFYIKQSREIRNKIILYSHFFNCLVIKKTKNMIFIVISFNFQDYFL